MSKFSTERLKAAVSAEVSFGWESDVNFRQHYRSFSRKFSSEIQRMFEKFMKYINGLKLFKFQLLRESSSRKSWKLRVFFRKRVVIPKYYNASSTTNPQKEMKGWRLGIKILIFFSCCWKKYSIAIKPWFTSREGCW